jgi:hypothetical protein
VGSEDRANAVFSCREGEITNIQFSHRNSLTEKRDWAGINPADWFAPSFARVRDFGLSKGRLGGAGPRADKPKEYEPANTLQQSARKCLNFVQSVRLVVNAANPGGIRAYDEGSRILTTTERDHEPEPGRGVWKIWG